MDHLTVYRDDLHQIPELSMKEHVTTQYLLEKLTAMGYEPERVLDTGCVVFIDAQKEKTVMFRCDIDGLPVFEQSDHEKPSRHEGMMHACGHDGHMAMLLGLAEALKGKILPYNVLLNFQPAEESIGGAEQLVKAGILEKYRVSACFGFHLMPFLPFGKIGLKAGPLMAECGELDVHIKGRSAHAGMPQDGVDVISVATALLNLYPTILTKRISPLADSLIHIGVIQGGTARNSVADDLILKGTVRAYDEKIFAKITQEINRVNIAMAEAYGCAITTRLEPEYPPVINDEGLTGQLKAILSNCISLSEPYMLGEDFSFYQREVPGVFMFLGTDDGIHRAALHAPQFNFDPAVLKTGVKAYLDILDHIRL